MGTTTSKATVGGQRVAYVVVEGATTRTTLALTVELTHEGRYEWLDYNGYTWWGNGRGDWHSDELRAAGYPCEGREVAR
jgi:hypothetical protein